MTRFFPPPRKPLFQVSRIGRNIQPLLRSQNLNSNFSLTTKSIGKIKQACFSILNSCEKLEGNKSVPIANVNPYKNYSRYAKYNQNLNPKIDFVLINQDLPPPATDQVFLETVQDIIKHTAVLVTEFITLAKEEFKNNMMQPWMRNALLLAVGAFVGFYYFTPSHAISNFVHQVWTNLNLTPQLSAAIIATLTGASTLLPATLQLVAGMLEHIQSFLEKCVEVSDNNNVQYENFYHSTLHNQTKGFAEIYEVLNQHLGPRIEFLLGEENANANDDVDDYILRPRSNSI